MCRKPRPKRSRSASSSASSPACPNGGWPMSWPSPIASMRSSFSRERARDDARDAGRLERVRHPRAVVVARRVDEDLRLALQAPERLRVEDPVAVALKRRAHAGTRPRAAARPRVSYERTASGESERSSCSRDARSKASATVVLRQRSRHERPSRSRRSALDDDRDGAAVGAPGGAGDVARARSSRGRRSRRRSPRARPGGRAAGPAPTFASTSSRSPPCWSASPPSPSQASVAVGPGVTALQRMPVLRVEVGDEPREREHGRLRDRVVRHPGRRALARRRGDVDDRAGAALAHAGQRGADRPHVSS